jgi:hypothetical protein
MFTDVPDDRAASVFRAGKYFFNVELEVLTAVTMNSTTFWVVKPCTARSFGAIYCLHLQALRVNKAGSQREAGSKQNE